MGRIRLPNWNPRPFLSWGWLLPHHSNPIPKTNLPDTQVRVIALDRPGFGKTSPNIAGTSQDASYTSDIVEVLLHENISQPISMIGYSLGGPAALRMAFFYPDKIKNCYLLAPVGFAPNLRATKGLMIETRVLHFMGRYCPWVLEMLWGVMGGELTNMPAYFNKFFSSTDPRDKELFFATEGTEELWITTIRECYRQGLYGMKMGLLGVVGKDAPIGLGFDVSKIKLWSASKVAIYHGRVDRFVGIEGSRLYLALLEKAGNDVELKEFPVEEGGGGHFGILTKMNGVLESEGQLYRNCE